MQMICRHEAIWRSVRSSARTRSSVPAQRHLSSIERPDPCVGASAQLRLPHKRSAPGSETPDSRVDAQTSVVQLSMKLKTWRNADTIDTGGGLNK